MKIADELELRAQEIEGLFARGDAKALPKATMALVEFIKSKVLPAMRNPCGPACQALSVRHRAFVHASLGGGPKGEPLSDTDAYLKAGYKVKTRKSAGEAGHRLSKKVKIRAAIAEHETANAVATGDKKQKALDILELMYSPDSTVPPQTRVHAITQTSKMEPGWLAPVETRALPGLDTREMIDRLIAAAKAGDEEAAAVLERTEQSGWKVDALARDYIAWLEGLAGIKAAK